MMSVCPLSFILLLSYLSLNNSQAMALMSSDLTSAPANLISSSLSKSVSVAPREVELALLCTFAKREGHWVKSPSEYKILFLYLLDSRLLRYLVYNLRKRGGDSADKYFKSTELIAGVKDMRFQALMPDVLHWLGIRKIDNMVSMSDMYVTRSITHWSRLTIIMRATQEIQRNRPVRNSYSEAV